MYYYLYDSSLSDKKYQNELARIETRLTDLGINGKINRLSFLKNISQIITEEAKRGIKTVVVVGNDKTINQIINLTANLNLTLGLIPVGPNNRIAKLLGIPEGEKACDILSARIIKRLDLGRINNYYFLTCIEMIGEKISLACDNNFFINLEKEKNIINVSNLNFYRQTLTNPKDGQLDLFIEQSRKRLWRKKEISLSRFQNKLIEINSPQSIPILINDEKRIVKTPAHIKISNKKLKIIVGKNRSF